MRLYIIFLAVSIGTHVIRTIYEILKTREQLDPEKGITFPLIFTNMALLWASWFMLCQSDPNKLHLTPVVKYTGLALIILGFILFATSLAQVKKFENYHGALITNGIFRYLRHPMYLGFIFWIAGGALFFESGTACILALFYIGNIMVWRKLEEMQLIKTYPDYPEYRKKTLF